MNKLTKAQLDADAARLGRRPALLERKWRRMSRSPFAFLRGASPLWATALAREPRLLRGVPGVGTLVGDLHLENVGVFRSKGGVTFHVNDFDETFEGPIAFDVLRLLTSTLLARDELRVSGVKVLTLAHAMLEGHAVGLAGGTVRAPAFVRALVAEVNALPPVTVLKKKVDAQGRLVRSLEKTPPAPASVTRRLPAALEQWRRASGVALEATALEVLDVTRRLAGTGSLGVERLLVLVRGDTAPWLLEVKELRGSPADLAAPSADRLVEVVRRVLPRPPAVFGAARLGRVPVVITRLSPKEDKLGVDEIPADAFEPYARFLGALVGEVHRRGGAQARWTATHRRRALDAAQHLAGLHETAFLHFCEVVFDRFGAERQRAARP
ncbi:MAG: DUF2252 family protein [Myxococcaceae bacterium]|nr:DUF2252 family protein [Myxococcaceae bacterium]